MIKTTNLSSVTFTRLMELSQEAILKSISESREENFLLVEVEITLEKKTLEIVLENKTIELEIIEE